MKPNRKQKFQSLLRAISKESLQDIIDISKSLHEIIKNLGLDATKQFYYAILKERIETDNLSLDKMLQNKKNYVKVPLDKKLELFVEHSTAKRNEIRYTILKRNLLEYKCFDCGLIDVYNGKTLTLQLDHINGVNDDHRLENLRWLCPNCHSQQPTSYGRNNKKVKIISLCECGNIKCVESKFCANCNRTKAGEKRRKFEVSKEELIILVKKFPLTSIGKMFNVSDNAVRRRCKCFGVDIKEEKFSSQKQ